MKPADEIERLRLLYENAKHWEAQWLAENARLRAALWDLYQNRHSYSRQSRAVIEDVETSRTLEE